MWGWGGGKLQINGERCFDDGIIMMENMTHANQSTINRTWAGLCLCEFLLFKLHVTQTTVLISLYQKNEKICYMGKCLNFFVVSSFHLMSAA